MVSSLDAPHITAFMSWVMDHKVYSKKEEDFRNSWGKIALDASYVTIAGETNNKDHNILTTHGIYSRGQLTQA
ncbi:unnamed protein product [Sphenostylis stenocarpa]|uniref:Uncharacterized protein n=1 Tax=Sphenostylis stenocarpa TaxID=92480 RepID=A0AA86RVK5_9FABA|nr:unnamed protein product [Sphenostylis stenocarpa]